MTHRNETLEGKALDLDNDKFYNCEIKKCVLQYAGGGIVLDKCTLQSVGWNFTGAAGRTLDMLHFIYTSTPGGYAFIEQIIEHIKSGGPTSPPVN